jgi:DNA repair protein RecO (recombination protein O)
MATSSRGGSGGGARSARPAAPLAAYVLHRWDWSETSLVVELFTREQGRLVVVARGAKRPTSQLRAVLLPFQPLLAALGRAGADEQGEIHPLRSAEWAGGAPLLDAAALLPAYHLNELLMKLLARQDPHPGLYDAYADTLAALAAPRARDGVATLRTPSEAAALRTRSEAASLRAFELLLLRETGLLPDLSLQTQTAQPLQPGAAYALHPEAGLMPRAAADAPDAALAAEHWLALQQALDAAPGPAGTAALRAACAPVATALRGPLLGVLHYHLVGTPLRTRQLRLELQRLARPAARSPQPEPTAAATDR